jgi:RND family efflux transporter MFP subunit
MQQIKINNVEKFPLLLLLAMAVAIAGCSSGTDEGGNGNVKAQETGEQNKTPRVKVVQPKKRDFTEDKLLTGDLIAEEKVTLYAMESGFVQRMHKDIGDEVTEGEVIAELKNPELARKRQKLEAQLKTKKKVYERLKSVYDKSPDLMTIEKVEEAEAKYESAKADLAATKDRLGFLKVRAPFDGVVTKRHVDKGAVLQTGLSGDDGPAIVNIKRIDPIRLSLDVPESDVSAIQKGTKATITIPELPNSTTQVKVSRMANALEMGSKTMDVQFDLDNPSFRLKPGMYAEVRLTLKSREGALTLPNLALSAQKDQYFVYVVRDGIVEKVPVRLGIEGENYFEVLNQELSTNDKVIVHGKQLVSDGAEVEAVKKQNSST